MARYDIETFLDEIEAALKANLNTKITALNTEKAGAPVLATISNDAYFLQELNGKTINHDPFILYGIEDIIAESRGPSSLQRVVVSVIIVVADEGTDVAIGKRIMRYARALKETLQDNWTLSSAGHKIDIRSLVPQSFPRLNSSEFYRAVGVEIETSIP